MIIQHKTVFKINTSGILIMSCTCLLIRILFFCVAFVPSSSMAPTIAKNSNIIETGRIHIPFSAGALTRGDIISFTHEEFDHILIKRIIGMPGDTISFQNGDVYINGVLLKEDYCQDSHSTFCEKTFAVPQDSVFCLGDNRLHSNDGRVWNNPYVLFDNIQGKYYFGYKVPGFLIPIFAKWLL